PLRRTARQEHGTRVAPRPYDQSPITPRPSCLYPARIVRSSPDTRRMAAPRLDTGQCHVAHPAKEDTMHRRHHLTLGLVGLLLLVGVGRSWGGPPNNDVSDAMGNTAGGTGALLFNATGSNNTAFGEGALGFTITGSNNTAQGAFALAHNTTGHANTASGFQA